LLALCTPWFTETVSFGGLSSTANCFIDGTCRNGGNSASVQGDAKSIFDAAFAMTLIAFFLSIAYVVVSLIFAGFVHVKQELEVIFKEKIKLAVMGLGLLLLCW